MDGDVDILSDLLRSMRISGSTLFNDDYASPWAIALPEAAQMAKLLAVHVGVRVVPFHFVKRGEIEITTAPETPLVVEAGEIAIGFGGMAHTIGEGCYPQALPVETLMAEGKNVFAPRNRAQVRYASCICGVFLLHNTELNPLLASLPPWLHLSITQAQGDHNFSRVADLLTTEIDQLLMGKEYVIDRLLELLCAEAIRSYMTSEATLPMGWLAGLKDPVVGGAISLIHAQPGEPWSVQRLAARMTLSPSRFAARFVAALGESPMAYVAKWRMNLASRLLTQTQKGVGEIASQVGYESLPAFNRAFKKHLGLPPAAWRSRH